MKKHQPINKMLDWNSLPNPPGGARLIQKLQTSLLTPPTAPKNPLKKELDLK